MNINKMEEKKSVAVSIAAACLVLRWLNIKT